VDFLFNQLVHDPDHLPQAPTQAGQLADDQAVPRGERAEQILDAPLCRGLSRGGLRLDELVDDESLSPRVIEHGHLLIDQVLGNRRDAQVSDRFHVAVYKNRKTITF
jgi:hypothetical protein